MLHTRPQQGCQLSNATLASLKGWMWGGGQCFAKGRVAEGILAWMNPTIGLINPTSHLGRKREAVPYRCSHAPVLKRRRLDNDKDCRWIV